MRNFFTLLHKISNLAFFIFWLPYYRCFFTMLKSCYPITAHIQLVRYLIGTMLI